MDLLTLLGLITGFMAIFAGQMLAGADYHSLMNLAAFLLVLGGTLGAVMVQTPMPTFLRAFKILPWVLIPPRIQFAAYKKLLVDLARRARQLGLLSLEEHIAIEKNLILKNGLELLVIGVDKLTIRQVLAVQIIHDEARDECAAHVFHSMGGYSPAIGILGAVLGLIQVMRHLADPTTLGMGIAAALGATIYGIGMANLIFLPIANKLKSCIALRTQFAEMIIEGMVAMAGGESPNMLQLKLNNFGPHEKNESQTS